MWFSLRALRAASTSSAMKWSRPWFWMVIAASDFRLTPLRARAWATRANSPGRCVRGMAKSRMGSPFNRYGDSQRSENAAPGTEAEDGVECPRPDPRGQLFSPEHLTSLSGLVKHRITSVIPGMIQGIHHDSFLPGRLHLDRVA